MIHKLLNIKYPIFQGAMANIATAEFAAAVSNAGGLGIIATGAMDAQKAREEIQKCKSLTNQPFGVNVMLMNPHSEEIIQVIIEEKVAVVTTGAGNPGKYVEVLKNSGCKVIPVVPSVALAIRMQNAGVDAVIAEGTEAGGHVGEQTTMVLIPQVCDAVSIPVIAAGGIGDGRGLNAAFALGASGVQLGTSLLVTKECPVHENYKKAVLKAKDTDTVVTGRSLSSPVRILKNKMARQYLQLEKEVANREEMEKLTLGALRRAVFDGDIDTGSVMIGQIAGLCKEELTLVEFFTQLIEKSQNEFKILAEKIEELQ